MNPPKVGPESCWTGRLRTARLICFFLVFTGLLLDALAATDEQKSFFALTEENDAFSNPFGPHQDRHYTQGLKLSYIFGDNFMTNTTARLNHLLLWGIQPEAGNLGIVFGQNIYTPEDLLDPAPIKNDRPYAGWLYAGAVYQRRGELASNLAVMENFEINLGVVGPESLAEQAQSTIHRWWFPDDVPRGWGNQLKTEPGIVLKYARLWRYSPTSGTARYFDIIPRIGGELGNVFTFATAGATARLGYNLPPDFGVQIIDSPASANGGLTRQTPWLFAYAFGSLDGRAVGHDITLDGNSFRSGPGVEKNAFIGDLSWGFAIQAFRHFEAAYTHVELTKQFRGQRGDDKFGSITVKLKFGF